MSLPVWLWSGYLHQIQGYMHAFLLQRPIRNSNFRFRFRINNFCHWCHGDTLTHHKLMHHLSHKITTLDTTTYHIFHFISSLELLSISEKRNVTQLIGNLILVFNTVIRLFTVHINAISLASYLIHSYSLTLCRKKTVLANRKHLAGHSYMLS